MAVIKDVLGGGGADEGGGDDHIVAEAREQGWVPLAEWRGDEAEWSDAETFVNRGKQINPILRKTLAKKDAEITRLRQEMTEQGATVKEIREYLKKVEDNAMTNALRQLKEQRREALANGDALAAEDLRDQMDELKAAPSSIPEVKAPAKQDPTVHPDVQEWMSENPWFDDRKNPELVEYANGAALSIQDREMKKPQAERLTPKQVLAEVAKKTRKVFAKQFEEFESPAPGMVEGGGGGGSSFTPAKSGKGFNSLPAEVKAQFERFYKAGFYVEGDKKMDKAKAQAEYFSNYQ